MKGCEPEPIGRLTNTDLRLSPAAIQLLTGELEDDPGAFERDYSLWKSLSPKEQRLLLGDPSE